MRRPQRFFLAGLACAVVATAVFLVFVARGGGAPLTEARLDAARARWEEQGPPSYDLEVAVRGAQRNDHRIEVRGGQVARMLTNGVPATGTAADYWTVDGMFRFLRDELHNLRRKGSAYGAADETEVVLEAEFDPEWGYPARFLRHVMGTRHSIEWEVVSFTPRGPGP